jgi:hypothetical protein
MIIPTIGKHSAFVRVEDVQGLMCEDHRYWVPDEGSTYEGVFHPCVKVTVTLTSQNMVFNVNSELDIKPLLEALSDKELDINDNLSPITEYKLTPNGEALRLEIQCVKEADAHKGAGNG